MIETGLKEKIVVITGAANGIGKATAKRFADEGCRVASWDVKQGRAEEGGLFQTVNVTDTSSIEAAVNEIVRCWGAPYVLVNNAGILRDGQLAKYKEGILTGVLSDEQFDSVISVNLKGVFNCTRAIAPRMIEAGGGVILSASSVVGHVRQFRPDQLRGG